MKSIAILVASSGNNIKLGNDIALKAKEVGLEVDFINLVDLDMPLYSTVKEKEGVPVQATELKEKIAKATSLVLVAPEYNGSMPPVLNNAIAWVSRTGEDWREAFNGKKALIATHSGSGGLHALMAMRQQLSYLGANVLGRQIHTHYKKEFNPDSAEACLKQLL